jgi:hypothetical protein
MPFVPQNFVNQVGPAIGAPWLNNVDQMINNTLGEPQRLLPFSRPSGSRALPQ